MNIPTGGPTEPAADIRQLAQNMRQFYIALTASGFSASEALMLVTAYVGAGVQAAAARMQGGGK